MRVQDKACRSTRHACERCVQHARLYDGVAPGGEAVGDAPVVRRRHAVAREHDCGGVRGGPAPQLCRVNTVAAGRHWKLAHGKPDVGNAGNAMNACYARAAFDGLNP